MPKQYTKENVHELFPYVEHNLRTICKSVLAVSNLYSNRVFSNIEVEGLEYLKHFKSVHPGSSFIYISRHRSHLDYFETQLALAKEKMPTRIQAGDNLFIGPFDPVLRETGAFMAIREGRGFYSDNWLLDTVYSLMPKNIGPYRKDYRVYINKKAAKILYEGYLEHILSHDEFVKDLLVYAEYTKQSDGSTKYGRSYDGLLNDFSPYLFIAIRRITSKLDTDFFYVPVNPSYERVIEDSFMTKIPSLKEKFSRDLVYLQEFAYITTRYLFPFFHRGRFSLKFGFPVKLDKPDNIKAAAVSDALRLRREVGSLETVFSPQLVFYSLQGESKVNLKTLEDRVGANLVMLDRPSASVHYMRCSLKSRKFDDLLKDVLRLFDAPGRRFIRINDNSLEVLDPSIVSQYGNHIAHLF